MLFLCNRKQHCNTFFTAPTNSGMKITNVMALLLLALLPFFAEAQNTEQLDARIDSLAEETATLDKIVKGLSSLCLYPGAISVWTGRCYPEGRR